MKLSSINTNDKEKRKGLKEEEGSGQVLKGRKKEHRRRKEMSR